MQREKEFVTLGSRTSRLWAQRKTKRAFKMERGRRDRETGRAKRSVRSVKRALGTVDDYLALSSVLRFWQGLFCLLPSVGVGGDRKSNHELGNGIEWGEGGVWWKRPMAMDGEQAYVCASPGKATDRLACLPLSLLLRYAIRSTTSTTEDFVRRVLIFAIIIGYFWRNPHLSSCCTDIISFVRAYTVLERLWTSLKMLPGSDLTGLVAG